MGAAERMILETAPSLAVERLEVGLGLSQVELAAALGASVRTLERWRSGDTHPQRGARRRLAEMVALEKRLVATFGESGREWLREPSSYLGGLTPADALRAGRADRVEAALEALDSGVFV